MIHVILFRPEIPQNTGNIGRLCACTNTRLHLIRPLGFSLSDRYLKRSGMDYWQYLDVREYIRNNGGCCRLCGFWKVYTNEQKALEMFRKYRICIRVYRQALKAGLPLSRLTVAA